ncbi:uncharacterized protein AB675_5748 [Cyphellophora attinorum]|uniref:Uncharacterized protein n=1 Tax=Cyphellophora attinorum TaxID=1664694 RepID=A0A0N1H771_9EURO|nr:uncharacterized protein AB675_5748 [Phialophora attinorum]KPI38737.1 hypothetical protein AB675_5748 [Phialophora attinorum]
MSSSANKTSPTPAQKKAKHEHSSSEEVSRALNQTSLSTPSTGPPPTTSNTTTMSDTEIDLFPSSTTDNNTASGPQTPPHNALNAAAPGELSPPRSQHNNTAAHTTNGTTSLNPTTQPNTSSMLSNGPTGLGSSFGGIGSGMNNNTNAGDLMSMSNVVEQQPGGETNGNGNGPGEWKSKKAQDEMQRAWEMVADKDWSAREFGDVVLRGRAARSQQQGT